MCTFHLTECNIIWLYFTYAICIATHQEPIVLKYVHFAHWTSSVLQQPRVYTAFMEFVSARQYPNHLRRFVRFDAHCATVTVTDYLLYKRYITLVNMFVMKVITRFFKGFVMFINYNDPLRHNKFNEHVDFHIKQKSFAILQRVVYTKTMITVINFLKLSHSFDITCLQFLTDFVHYLKPVKYAVYKFNFMTHYDSTVYDRYFLMFK